MSVQGELIVKEDPVLVVNMSLPDSERKSILLEQFKKLGGKDRRKIESLYDSDPEGAVENQIMRIFKSNSIQGKSFISILFSPKQRQVALDVTDYGRDDPPVYFNYFNILRLLGKELTLTPYSDHPEKFFP